MKKNYFITGTDTDVGKTLVAASLLHSASDRGLVTLGLKPVAAGCDLVEGQLKNSDALALMEAASVELIYDQVNPVALEAAIAPHIAAQKAGVRLNADRLVAYCKGSLMRKYDFAVVEGAGGWRVPLNDRETLASVAKQLNFPVILVVGMKLGCISHALLTAEAIVRDGLPFAGWVANRIDPEMEEYEANLDSLKQRLPGLFLGAIPFIESVDPRSVAKYLAIDQIL